MAPLKVLRALDPMPSAARLQELYYERTGIRVGPASPLLDGLKRELRKERRTVAVGSVGSVRTITDDDIDPTGRINRWERQRAGELEVMRKAKLIRWGAFDAISLRLADRTFYHTDFFYETADKDNVIEEVKGFMRDDAAVKLKVAASQYPHIRFLLVTRAQGETGWTITQVKAA